jgi:ParB family chromosome partitioning protein
MAAEGRRGLGRGLAALLGEQAGLTESADDLAQPGSPGWSYLVPIEMLRRNPDQPRKSFDELELDTLAASIRKKGVIQPLMVRPLGGGEYEIVAGERRWRAAQRAGLRELPVVIRILDDSEVLQIAIIENVQRADLNAVEEAAAYRALIDQYGHSQEDVAEAVGKSRSHVANTLRLLALPEDVRGHVVEGRLSAGHARAVATAADPSALARKVIEAGLNVRETEALARRTAGEQGRAGRPSARFRVKDADTVDLENNLAEMLGLGVQILDKGGVGEVRVHYTSLEQLDEVCRRLGRR